ncbi:hypothetical protein E2K98_27355 [Bacillus salipaludis]|uniref:NodB homology domain-containing protein n=1 Tax=Bacillus salipaludis TaxID=2547811 RepID=A0A4R5VJ43_9BACI|nr:polysaccharide deacetylase family protein [Bacillus salipaludis]TDK56198.1 hypothetical protein E2K98_27355 [Bacillus salipaludis]
MKHSFLTKGKILLFLTLIFIAGCAANTTQQSSATSSPKKRKQLELIKQIEQKVHKEHLLAKAKASAQQYDYQKALTLLKKSSILKDEDIQNAIDTYEKQKKNLVTWPDNSKIPHLFFHSLIVDPSKAFDGDDMAQGYQDYMVTIAEFKNILNQLYEKGFVLVSIQDIAKLNKNGKMVYQNIKLPSNKKPLVLSQDDVSYYEYMKNDGFAKNLTLDANGNLTNTYINKKGKVVQGAYDLVPILDHFVDKHPDFSYKGAKGIISLTGYNGVLGYRTSESQYGPNSDKPNPNIKKDRQQAKKVADAMKQEGWEFASHTWGHLNAEKVSLDLLKKDTSKWKQEVEPIVGPTETIIFAFGSDIGDWRQYSNNKYHYLKSQGFDYYANVDASKITWSQLGLNYFRQSRINVDGLRMRGALTGENEVLEHFFNVKLVFDSSRPNAKTLIH